MGNPYLIEELLVEDEASLAENENSVTSNTFSGADGIPILEPVDISGLTQTRESDGSLQSRQNDSRPGFLGLREGTISFRTYLCGHGGATTGSLTANWIYTLLKDGLGGGSAADSGTDIDTGAGTPDADTIYTTANPADFAAGSILRLGALGDGDGEGQCGVVSTVSTQTVEMLTAFPGAAVDQAVVYAMLQAYPTESLSTTKRFLIGKRGTGEQIYALGCQLAGLQLSFPVGGMPEVTWTYQVAYWERAALTIPSGETLRTADTAPISSGTLFWQDVGTTTRATISAASLELELDIGLIPHRTVGGGQYRTITGYSRTRCVPTLTITPQDWASAYETLFQTDGSSTTQKHVLFSTNATDGRVFAFYMPRAYPVGEHPKPMNVNDLVGTSFQLRGREGPTTTSDLTRSAIRFGIG